MQAESVSIIKGFFEDKRERLKIPVYQRNYDWLEINTKTLLNDIYKIIHTKKNHFLGTIVYMPSNLFSTVHHEYLIIDGQQRLTTIAILFKALLDISDDKNVNKALQSYLFNDEVDREYKIKLKPVKSDDIQYTALLNNQVDRLDQEAHIYKNYKISKKEFQSWLHKDIQPMQILEAIKNLNVVSISLVHGEDDPQLIFESINSTGVPLSKSDLIRNFLLMNDLHQDRLFEQYWIPLENKLRTKNSNAVFDTFFRQFLITKNNKPVNRNNVYENFVEIFDKENYTNEKALGDLTKYANYYYSFINPNSSKYNEEIKEYLTDLKQLNQTTCYPFLMHVFDDYENKKINEDTLTKVVKLIDIYLIRRSVCKVSTNSLNGLFAYLYARVYSRVKSNQQKYYESLNKYLFSLDGKDKFPDDIELRDALLHVNLYQNLALCKLLMLDIENGDTKEKLDGQNLTVEHIMPQTLNASWKINITDEDHSKYISTLGNLSLTGYNSEMSNKNFKEKQKILSRNSKVKILNEDVLNKKSWSIKDIEVRGNRLANILVNRYQVQKVNDPLIKFELTDTLTLDKPELATGRKPTSFALEGITYKRKTFKDILLSVVKLLDQEKPEILESLVGLIYSGKTNDKASKQLIRKSNSSECELIRDGYYIYTSLSAFNIFRLISLLLDKYGINENKFSILVKKEE